jgi:folate-dependent phosphoribosylglycinamide formyltransferase PurN
MSTPLNVAVLTCGPLGFEVAARLREIPEVGEVRVFTTPYRMPQRSAMGTLKHLHRMEGWPGVIAAVRRRLGGGSASNGNSTWSLPSNGESFTDFHDNDCRVALRGFSPDLGVVAGTYILKPQVFTIPRLGCINLHSGKVPEYRGAAPGFWELYNGEREVGITIHRVTDKLDGGAVLLQELFPLDPAPATDPSSYLEWLRDNVLRPNGIRMLAEAVARIARGEVTEEPQDLTRARTYRSPDYRTLRELRRRVAARRAACVAG